jgi:GntR family phosphonate transport system transcriptional regulator
LIASSSEPASDDLAAMLRIIPGTVLLRLETLGEADGTPLSRAVHWFDAERFSGLVEAYGREGSITRALAACGVPDYVRVSTEISAAPATGADREDLALQPGAVVLLTRSVNADPQGRPIQASRSRFAADRVTLSVATGEAQGDLP